METIVACVLSFAVTALLGRWVILPALRRLKAGQEIREVGPKWHATKAGTPTMGGLMFIIGIAAAIIAAGWRGFLEGNLTHIYLFLFSSVFGVIGFLDDYEKVKRHQNLGLTAIQKFLLQLAAAILFLMLMRYDNHITPHLYVPFLNVDITLSWPLYMVFCAFVIVGAVNAVNITDGLDGLAASVTVPITSVTCRGAGSRRPSSTPAALPISSDQVSVESSMHCVRAAWSRSREIRPVSR